MPVRYPGGDIKNRVVNWELEFRRGLGWSYTDTPFTIRRTEEILGSARVGG